MTHAFGIVFFPYTAPGDDGPAGIAGPPGPSGPPGSPAISGGTTYVRWGKTACPNVTGTELVYAGITAGSFFDVGGGANYICTVNGDDVEYHPEATTTNANVARLYGTEYQIESGQALSGLNQHNAPCAVCEVTNRSKQIMIPGRYTCPDTWTVEYSGWLMTINENNRRTMFICMDKNPEAIAGREANDNGALLYHVEGNCGTGQLPCPGYDGTKEMSCVVCTK